MNADRLEPRTGAVFSPATNVDRAALRGLEFLRRTLEFLHAFQTALNQHAADMLRMREAGGTHRIFRFVLEADDILDYARYICGFHIQGMGQSIKDENLCPLDWYYQSCQQRMKDPNVWDHYLLHDQVSPVDFWKAKTVMSLGTFWWPDHRIGCDASWRE